MFVSGNEGKLQLLINQQDEYQIRPKTSGFAGSKIEVRQKHQLDLIKIPRNQISSSSSHKTPYQIVQKAIKLFSPKSTSNDQTLKRNRMSLQNYVFEFDQNDNLVIHNLNDKMDTKPIATQTEEDQDIEDDKKFLKKIQDHDSQRVFSAAFSKNNRVKSSAFWKIQKTMDEKKMFGKSKSQATFNPILYQVSKKLERKGFKQYKQFQFYRKQLQTPSLVHYKKTKTVEEDIPFNTVTKQFAPLVPYKKQFSVLSLTSQQKQKPCFEKYSFI